ncbi:hypothetical protein BJX63DRAFT_437243 [Aspergillus granulosus]|uniref:Uncharacterized protein n=1 Tax=Aspergillus granulosus TaxID=176169 RepID=A0ABR4GVU0_9EURO
MDNLALLQSLSIALPALLLQGIPPVCKNPPNTRYHAQEITEIIDWPDFTYDTIIQKYSATLNSKQTASLPTVSPPAAIRPKHGFRYRVGAEQLNLVPVTFDHTFAAAYVDNSKADTAFKWSSGDRYSGNPAMLREYKQVLAQINFYIGQRTARYGFVPTNTELIAIKRCDTTARLARTTLITRTTGGLGQPPVQLSLWYIRILATDKMDWSL